MPGIISERLAPRRAVFICAAWIKNPTADRGEVKIMLASFPAVRVASIPISGSRMMFEKTPEAAEFGNPGRTHKVGIRRPTPSKNPRRL
ncbi:unannotated protein [freshwater metagenome]|uniref:Unannotated protein n=1 Tax=freshwater metagenome TaxID=449393 RepID=A0A6J6VVH6_9ZZZZ